MLLLAAFLGMEGLRMAAAFSHEFGIPTVLASTLSVPAANESGSIVAEVNIYSGRQSPEWAMSEDEIALLKSKLKDLPASVSVDIPSWGYVVVNNAAESTELPYSQIYFYQDSIIAIDDSGSHYFKDTGDIKEWLVGLGDQHDPGFIPPLYKTLPPGTPYIAVVPSFIEASAEQNEESKSVLTIFSEGNADLWGTIAVPQFISSEPASFSLQKIDGATDIVLTADTKKTGEISGDIVVKSNDPSNPEIKIPVKITIKEAPKARAVSSLPAWRQLFYPVLCVLLILVLAAAAAIMIAKKRFRKKQ